MGIRQIAELMSKFELVIFPLEGYMIVQSFNFLISMVFLDTKTMPICTLMKSLLILVGYIKMGDSPSTKYGKNYIFL